LRPQRKEFRGVRVLFIELPQARALCSLNIEKRLYQLHEIGVGHPIGVEEKELTPITREDVSRKSSLRIDCRVHIFTRHLATVRDRAHPSSTSEAAQTQFADPLSCDKDVGGRFPRRGRPVDRVGLLAFTEHCEWPV